MEHSENLSLSKDIKAVLAVSSVKSHSLVSKALD